MTTLPSDARVVAARGNLYLSREVCEARLPGIASVALLSREDGVHIVPLAPGSAGGLLLKVRNRRGDRVVHAQEFFRLHGYVEEFDPREHPARWDPDRAALVVAGLKRTGM